MYKFSLALMVMGEFSFSLSLSLTGSSHLNFLVLFLGIFWNFSLSLHVICKEFIYSITANFKVDILFLYIYDKNIS